MSRERLGPYPHDRGPLGGGTCYTCESWFTPPSPLCPSCNSAATLAIPFLAPSQVTWLRRYAEHVLPIHPWLRCLGHLPSWAIMNVVRITHHWLRHLHSHLHRWTPSHIPSVPILSNGRTLCLWLEDPDHLRHPPCDTIWAYTADTTGALQLHPFPTATLTVIPPCQLAAECCSRCGRPSSLTATLLLPAQCHYQGV